MLWNERCVSRGESFLFMAKQRAQHRVHPRNGRAGSTGARSRTIQPRTEQHQSFGATLEQASMLGIARIEGQGKHQARSEGGYIGNDVPGTPPKKVLGRCAPDSGPPLALDARGRDATGVVETALQRLKVGKMGGQNQEPGEGQGLGRVSSMGNRHNLRQPGFHEGPSWWNRVAVGILN